MTDKELIPIQAEELNLKSLLNKYLKYWYLFAASILLSIAVAYAYLRYSTPMYSVSSTILVKDYQKGPDLFGNAVFHDLDLFNTFKNINNEIYILKSPDLMEQVLTELEMHASFFVEGKIKTQELYGSRLPIKVLVNNLDSTAFGKIVNIHIYENNRFELEEEGVEGRSSHFFGEEIKKPYGVFTIISTSEIEYYKDRNIRMYFHDMRRLASHYNSKLNVSMVDQNASVLQISIMDAISEKGKDIITKLVEVYNRETIDDKNQIAANTIDFIDERLKFLTSELSDVEKDVEQYKRRYGLTDVSSEAKLYLDRASNYNQQLSELEIQLDVLQSIGNYLEKQNTQFELVPSSLNLQDPTLIGLITKFNDLQLERERMLRTTQQDNPVVLDMTEQLENLRLNILENIRNIQEGMQITKNKLQANSVQFESRIQKVPSIERELLEINRQQGIKQGLYLYLLQKREESALSLAATAPSSRVIVAARAGDFPIAPKKQITYLIALMMGLGIPFLFVYIKELMNDKIQNKSDVEKNTSTPILGEIAHKEGSDTLVVTEKSTSPVAELFRLARTNLQFVSADKENKVILITSSMSGEGKTFFSINLAASLALVGKKTVIIDFDFRKPRLMHYLGLSNDEGVTNCLISNDLSISEFLKPSRVYKNLDVIGSGPIPPNPAELMQLPKVGELIHYLKNEYDYVLIDTSPVGQVADALSLSVHTDSSLYVVRYNYTLKDQLKIIDDIYKQGKMKNPMLILNDAKKNNGYGYGYGYGYNLERKNKWTLNSKI